MQLRRIFGIGPYEVRRTCQIVCIACALTLAGCASTNTAPQPAAVQPSLPDFMSEVDQAIKQGDRERARQRLRDAAKAYPTAKEPWLRLADSYFEAEDYGNAILAGQEVLLRDPYDRTAQSVLAVSGLRVSTAALTSLRGEQSGVPNNTRSEAQGLTRVMRELLGEQVLVPRPEPAAQAPKPRTASSGTTARPVAAARPPAAASGVPTAPTGAGTAAGPSASPTAAAPASPAAVSTSGNPFDRLR